MIKPENYYVVHGWMITDLKLSGIALQVYAIIYGFSQDDKSVYNGGQQYLMDWTGCERNTVKSALKKLLDDGLVECIQGKVHGRDGYLYRTLSKNDSVKNQQCQKLTETVSKNDSVPLSKIDSVPYQKLTPSTPAPSYSPADLPPAPYNNIKKDIKKNKDEEEEAGQQRRLHSFSFQDNGKAIISLPCTDGELTFTGEDVKDLQAAFVDLNIIAELKQIALKLKTCKVDLTADRARRYVNSWMTNSQNKRASSSNVWQNTTSQAMSPEDPRNPFTHPEYDKEGNKLDYDGNIVKTAKQLREERKAEEDRKEAERIAELERSQEEFDRLHPDLPDVVYRRKRKLEEQQAKQNPTAKKSKPNYAAMTEDELKAQLKPIKGEPIWEYKVRTVLVKQHLQEIEQQKQQKAVNE